jgi:hypothetical protein
VFSTGFPPYPAKYLCFHRHSGFAASFPQRSFVFIEIPALLVHFLGLLRVSWQRLAMTYCRFGEKDGTLVPEVPSVMAELPDIKL